MRLRVGWCTVLSLGLVGLLTGLPGCSHNSRLGNEQPAGPKPPTASATRSVTEVAHESQGAVVIVTTYDASGQLLEQGSGFMLSADGKVVTNYHVVEGARAAAVKFADGGIYGVTGMLAADKDVDIAVLKLKSTGREFPFLRAGDSTRMNVGDEIVAIGSPVGLEGTVSTGIISARRNRAEIGGPSDSDMEAFQITAPISHGSSGGALLNSAGEVIGVPFAARLDGQNLNFAIPIKYVLPFVADAALKPFPDAPQPPAQAKRAVAHHDVPSPPKRPIHVVSDVDGTYTGIWQSGVFAASGAAVMTVSTEGTVVRADIALTGGSITRETLTGDVTEVGGGWSVKFKTASGDLYATGIFKGGVFEGNYDYVPASDHGRWALKKD